MIRNGELLNEKTLPVPTKKIEKDIRCLEMGGNFSAYREKSKGAGKIVAYLGKGRLVEIDKPTYSDEADRVVPYVKYDFLDCFVPKFKFSYRQDGPVNEWPEYQQLSSVSAYLYLEDGLLLIIKEILYFLSATDRRFYVIGKVGKGVFKIELGNNRDIHFHYVTQYKVISENKKYERSGGDFTGYTDEYEISEKTNVLTKDRFQKLLNVAKEKIMPKGQKENSEKVIERSDNFGNHGVKNIIPKIANCSSCVAVINPNSKFCDQCGKKVEVKFNGVKINTKTVSAESSEFCENQGELTKYTYWEDFIKYTEKRSANNTFAMAGFKLSEAADRNWYALRLGTAKARIELSINTKTNNIRTALFIKDINLWNKIISITSKSDSFGNGICIDDQSKTPSISVYKKIEGMCINRCEHYKWFMECAVIFKQLFKTITA